MATGFALKKNGNTFNFYSQNTGQMNSWITFLDLFVIHRKIKENYKITQCIGKGSFAQVFLASLRTKQKNNPLLAHAPSTLAIKSLTKETMKVNKQSLDNVKTEIQILNSLRSCQNILQLDKVYEGQEHIYLAMHYEKGGTVTSRVRSKGPFNESTLMQFAEILF